MAKLIGTGNNQVPTNGMLGGMAFQSPEDVQVDKLQEEGYNVVTQQDIGTAPNQVPINGFLGSLAYLDSIQGIDFSPSTGTGTATSNILDDYEEGTWTPVWTQTGGFTLGNGTLEGTYTKVGRLVYIIMRFEMGSTTSIGTGYVHTISGLPFTIQTNTNTFLATASNSSNNWIGWSNNYSSNTSSLNYIQFVRSGNVQDGMYNTSPFTWTTGDDLRMSGSYFTAQ